MAFFDLFDPTDGGLLGNRIDAQSPGPSAAGAGPPSGIGDWIGDNRAALMALGAGIAGGRNWGEGIGKGLEMAVSAARSDQQRQMLAAQQAATVQGLRARGIPDAELIAAMNPYMARILLSRPWSVAGAAGYLPSMADGGGEVNRNASLPGAPARLAAIDRDLPGAASGGLPTTRPAAIGPLSILGPPESSTDSRAADAFGPLTDWRQGPFRNPWPDHDQRMEAFSPNNQATEPDSAAADVMRSPQFQPSVKGWQSYKPSTAIPQGVARAENGDRLGDAASTRVWASASLLSRPHLWPSPEQIAITQNDVSVQDADRMLFGRNTAPTITGSAYVSGVTDGYATQNSDGSWTVSASREHPGIVVSISRDRSHAIVTTVTEGDTVTIEPDGSVSTYRA